MQKKILKTEAVCMDLCMCVHSGTQKTIWMPLKQSWHCARLKELKQKSIKKGE